MRDLLLFPVVAAILLAAAGPATAQTEPVSPAAQPVEAVRATVVRLFDGMRAADSTAIRSTLHPQATLKTVVRVNDSGYRLAETPISAFVTAVGRSTELLDERIGEIDVHVDDGLATAWMAYRFYVGDRFSHCGVNAMQLVLTPEGWQILTIVDTRRQGCE